MNWLINAFANMGWLTIIAIVVSVVVINLSIGAVIKYRQIKKNEDSVHEWLGGLFKACVDEPELRYKILGLVIGLIFLFALLSRLPALSLYKTLRSLPSRLRNSRLERSAARKNKRQKEWLKKNPVQLCYNFSCGIFVFVKAADYHRAVEKREKWKAMEAAEHDKWLFSLLSDSVVMATEKARDRYPRSYFVSGDRAMILKVLENSGVVLERKEDIFVPLVNAFVLDYEEMEKRLATRVKNSVPREQSYSCFEYLTKQPLPENLR